MNTDNFIGLESKLDTLRTELMYIISNTRDTKDINEKIFKLSTKYKEPEILELIMFVNSSITIDVKQIKESLVRAIDSIIALKKEQLKFMLAIDHRVKHLEHEFETNWKGFCAKDFELKEDDTQHLYIQSINEQSVNKEPLDEVNILGMDITIGKLKILGYIWISLIITIAFIFFMFTYNKEAAQTTLGMVGTTHKAITGQ